MSWANARKFAEEIEAHERLQQSEPLEFLEGGAIRIGDRFYRPNKTGIKYHESQALTDLVVGPFGSGKTSMWCAGVLHELKKMPLCLDGKRRMKVGVFRNTLAELMSTTLPSWNWWTECLGDIKPRSSPILEQTHHFFFDNIETELHMVFIGLDHIKDIRKLKSFELSHAVLEEVCEIIQPVFDIVPFRCGRYPPKDFLEHEMTKKIMCATNPFNTRHYLYKQFETKKTEGLQIFHQPPGLIRDSEDDEWETNPNADNIEHLETDYYKKSSYGKSKEFIKVFCLGEYGTLRAGKPVFPAYNDNLHAVDDIEFDPEYPLYLGWDGGLTPACLIEQYVCGQRRSILEFTTERMDVRELAEMIVKPYLDNNLKGYKIYSSDSDPAGGSGSDKFHITQILKEVGIDTVPAITNNLVPRHDAVNFYLNRLVDGNSAYIVSKKGCPILREGYLGEYKNKQLAVIGEVKYHNEPEKNHPHSDIQDCGQYVALRMRGELSDEEIEKNKRDAEEESMHRSEWV